MEFVAPSLEGDGSTGPVTSRHFPLQAPLLGEGGNRLAQTRPEQGGPSVHEHFGEVRRARDSVLSFGPEEPSVHITPSSYQGQAHNTPK